LVQNLKRGGRDLSPPIPETFAMVDGRQAREWPRLTVERDVRSGERSRRRRLLSWRRRVTSRGRVHRRIEPGPTSCNGHFASLKIRDGRTGIDRFGHFAGLTASLQV
jgi:hypothetical protein